MNNVLFDMDGVLIDSELPAFKAWSKCLLPHDLMPLWSSCLGVTVEDEYQQFKQRLNWTNLQYRQFCAIVAKYMPENLPFKSGALELVKSLKQTCKVAVVSSSPRQKINQRLKGYLGLFDCIVSGDNLTHGKPDPEIYQVALEQLQAKPEECWVLEDSPSGIKSARQAGIQNLVYVTDTVPYTLSYTDVIVVHGSLLNVRSLIQRG